MVGASFSSVEKIEQRLFYYMCGFSFFSPLSIFVGVVFLALMTLGLIHRLFRKHDDILKNIQPYKKIFLVTGILLSAVFISALSSDDIFFGIKKFVEKHIFHVILMLPLVFFEYGKEKIILLVKLLVAGAFLSNLFVIIEAMTNFSAEQWRFDGLLPLMQQASLLAVALPIYVILFMHVKEHKLKIFFFAAIIVGVAATLFNGTRGVWLALLILIPAAILFLSKNKFKSFGILLASLAIVGGIFFATPTLSNRLATITDMQMQSNSERLLMWKSAFNMFKDHPLLGVGYGQYKTAYKTYVMPEAKEKDMAHAHNNIMQMLADCGIVGLSAFILMIVYFSYFSLKGWQKEKNIAYPMFFFVLWGTMLHGLTEFNFESAVIGKLFWFSLGLCLAFSRSEKIIPLRF